MFEAVNGYGNEVKIVVIGVGTVGCKILSSSLAKLDASVDTIFIHSNEQFLSGLGICEDDALLLKANERVSKVNTPRDAYLALRNCSLDLEHKLSNADVVFVLAGLGGATGSGCSPYIAKLIKRQDSLCIGMFSLPFSFEGRGKKGSALLAYSELRKHTDSLLVIENEKFLNLGSSSSKLSNSDLFRESNVYFSSLISGLSNLVIRPGLINIDLQDLRTVLKSMGPCSLGFGSSKGKNRAKSAVLQAIAAVENSGASISSAKGCVVSITAGPDFSITQFEDIGNEIQRVVGDDIIIVVGSIIDMDIDGCIEVTVILSGLKDLVVDTEATEDGFFTEVIRNIEFESHQASSGISILAYFGEIIKQKHTGVDARVRIEQTSDSVVLIIETPDGEVEKVEKTLEEYGQVILGKKTPAQFLPNELDAQRLELKLEMASMELRQNEKLLQLYESQNNEYKGRIDSMEVQLFSLQNALSNGLTSSNKNLELFIDRQEQIPSGLIQLLELNKNKQLTKETTELIESQVRNLYQENHKGFLGLTDLVRNGVYGVVGNSLYNYLIVLINTFPK